MKIEVPNPLIWVVKYLIKLYCNKENGEMILSLKQGGVCNIKKSKGYDIVTKSSLADLP